MTFQEKLVMLYKLFRSEKSPKIFSFHDCLPDVFSRYIEVLVSKRYRFLGSDDLLDHRTSGTFSKKDVVLTFDDGRRNCWSVIFPLLKKYHIKAIFFIIPSRIKESGETYPNLEDYWKGTASWENLYVSHRRQPYLTWKELEIIKSSGLVDIHSHSLKHEVVCVSPRVVDFQHPGVYEMPVYFDEWYGWRHRSFELCWGAPVYERAWAPLAANVYMPPLAAQTSMEDFVKENGGFLFFKKKEWRQKLFDYYDARKKTFTVGHFKKNENAEDLRASILESKKIIEDRLKKQCSFFSLPLYQGLERAGSLLAEAGYKGVFTGPNIPGENRKKLPLFTRIPGFWIKFLAAL